MLQFENPVAFLFLLVIPALYILRRLGVFSRISFPLILSDWKGSSFQWKNSVMGFTAVLSTIFFIVGFILIIFSLAHPVVSRQEKVYTSRGTDILFVIDTSPSMAAFDIGSSTRLDAARQTVLLLTKDLPGISFGLVAMSSEAALVVPPTLDHTIFIERMNKLLIGELGDGTAIGTGLSTAVYHLISSQAPKKCIVLLTDGENNSGTIHPITAARISTENNIPIYTVAIGTKGSVPVEYVDPISGRVYSGYLDSDFDDSQLREIATLTGGANYTVDSIGSLVSTLSSIGKKEAVVQTYQLKTVEQSYYIQVLLIALCCVVCAWILRRIYMKEIL